MCKTQRQDIHAPRNFDQSRYEYVGVWAFGYEGHLDLGEFYELRETRKQVEHLLANGWRWADHHRGAQCDICGANHVYSIVLICNETQEILRIGGDCALKYSVGGDFNALANVKRAVADWQQLKAGKTKAFHLLKEADLDAEFALQFAHVVGSGYQPWLEGFVAGLGVDIEKRDLNPELDKCHKIRDIIHTIIRNGRLCEKQSKYLGYLLDAAKNFASDRERRETQQRERREASKSLDAAVGERVRKLVGEVKVAKDFESQFGWSTFFAITTEGGEVVKGFYSGSGELEKGDKIQFDATVKAHEDDPKWGKSTTVNRIKFVKIDEPSNV